MIEMLSCICVNAVSLSQIKRFLDLVGPHNSTVVRRKHSDVSATYIVTNNQLQKI